MTNLVTFEQAVQLKELGLNEATFYFYSMMRKNVEFSNIQTKHNESKLNISAPTVSSALDWIREEKHIPCSVHLEFEENNKEWFHYGEYGIKGDNRVYDTDVFDTHPLAESALLTAALTYLIENK